MRFIFGIVIGSLLTVGGAYVIDTKSPAEAKQMVNWDVVATNLDRLAAFARERWKKSPTECATAESRSRAAPAEPASL